MIFWNVYTKVLLKIVRLSGYEIFFARFLLYCGILRLVNSVLKQGFPWETESLLSCFNLTLCVQCNVLMTNEMHSSL